MNNRDERTMISPVQLLFLVFGTVVGVGFLTLPRGVVEKAREDAWITVILAAVIALGSLWLVIKVAGTFPGDTVFEYNRETFGSVLGFLFNVLFVLYFLFFTVTGVRTMAEVVRAEMLPFTPLEIIVGSMLLTILYTTWQGLMPIVRLNESGLPITMILVVIFFLFAYLEADWSELRRPFLAGVAPVVKPLPSTVYSYLGYEVIYLYYPYLVQKQRAYIGAATGIALAAGFYTFIVLGTLVTLGADVTMTQTYPVVTMAKVIEVVRQFVERAELLLLILWLPLAYSTHVVTYYSAGFSLNRTFPAVSVRLWLVILLPVTYILSLVPDNMIEMDEWSKRVGQVGVFLLLGYPLLVLAVHAVRRKWERAASGAGESG